MRKILTAAAVAAFSGAAMLAVAAAPQDSRPEARAYLNFQFGNTASLPSNFHYGLRLDRDSRFTPAGAPAVLQMDLTDSGLINARLNGLSLLSRNLSSNQAEGAAVAAASYSAADIGLIVLGVAGVGVAGYEVSKSSSNDSTPAASSTGSSTGGSTTGGSTTGGSTTGGSTGGTTTGGSTTGGSTSGSALGGLLGLTEFPSPSAEIERHTPEYQQWLDGGSGQMGDLNPAH